MVGLNLKAKTAGTYSRMKDNAYAIIEDRL